MDYAGLTLIFFLTLEAAGVIAAGAKLPGYGEKIGARFGWSSSAVGVFLIAGVTSLPELVSIIGTMKFLPVPQPDLLLGNLFGSNLFNITLLVFLDVLSKKSIYPGIRKTQILLLTWGVALNTLALVGLMLDGASILSLFNIWSLLIVIAYGLSAWHIGSGGADEHEVTKEDTQNIQTDEETTSALLWKFLATSVVIVICGLFLCKTLDDISIHYGLARTFLGNLFLAGATSLPELIVSYSAIKQGFIAISIGNLFGSNLMNLTFIFIGETITLGKIPNLFVDAAYPHRITLVCVLLAYGVVAACGGKENPDSPLQKRFRRIGIPSLCLLGLFVSANVFAFFFSG